MKFDGFSVMVVLMISIGVLAHLILPFICLRWVAFNKGKNKIYRISVLVFVGVFFVTMWMGGSGWHWFGKWWPILFILLFIPAAILLCKNLKQVQWLPENKFWPWFNTIVMILFTIMYATDLPEIFKSRNYDGMALNLKFPLRSGTYHIGHGGSSSSMNHHFEVRAQKYALDISKLNTWGVRARGLMPSELSAYEIFGDKLIAPCSGEVISIESKLVDNIPPKMDSKNLLGNHVILFCVGHSVLLAHLKKDSVTVKIGDKVETGFQLAEAGNTGNTTEPHLHIHAVKGKFIKTEEIAGTAEGVPILFDNKFLIRNDRVTYLD